MSGVILATSRSFSDGDIDLLGRLDSEGYEVVRGPSGHELDDLADVLPRVDAWIAGTGPVTAAHMELAPRLRVIARYGVGIEAVDLDAARARGIAVTNTPGANSDAVADHAVGLMLAALRSVAEGDRRVRQGDWRVVRGRQLASLTVGIVGFGRIGQGVAQRLGGFAPRILAADPFLDEDVAARLGAASATVEDVWGACDLITFHAPGGETLVTQAALAAARPGCVLINTARADLVDEAALAAALREGRIGAYAADSLAGDTRGGSSPLLADDLAERVTITPHFGAQTVEAVDNMGAGAVENALAVLAGRTPPNPVVPVPDASGEVS
ncbi:NAD(P)-dependent oxidoreductase [Microbacterium karelineae]|uniref:NAD(P)-dependent oxidoreductase n=1 Tax=Microbacterium karelineae TaxID=2654283 RepID=UPI0012EA798E|nr:NAD(P)-dependent oxidoreductase [Microbacterium karelineae]